MLAGSCRGARRSSRCGSLRRSRRSRRRRVKRERERCIYRYIHTSHTYTYIQININKYIYIYTYIYIYVYIHIHTWVCMYVYCYAREKRFHQFPPPSGGPVPGFGIEAPHVGSLSKSGALTSRDQSKVHVQGLEQHLFSRKIRTGSPGNLPRLECHRHQRKRPEAGDFEEPPTALNDGSLGHPEAGQTAW